jgi:hypothetical protein
MPGVAAIQGSGLNPGVDAPLAGPAPKPFFDALGAAFGPNLDDEAQSAAGRRDLDLESALWERHRAVEKVTGRKVPLSQSLTGQPTDQRGGLKRALDAALPVDRLNAALLGRPGVVSDDDYETELEALRAGNPALAGVETRAQILKRLQSMWSTRRNTADALGGEGAGGLVGAFAGRTVGSMMNLPQAGLAVATGGAGAGRQLAVRMLAQAGVNAGAAALDAPEKLDEATRLGGPKYQAADALLDVGGAAVGGAAFEGAFAGARAGLRQLGRLRGAAAPDPALRGALNLAEQGAGDDLVLGDVKGADYDLALDALATGAPPPRLEPDRDLDALFSSEGGAGSPSTVYAPVRDTGDLASEPSTERAMYKGRPIYAQAFDPGDLTTDAATFQYKSDADAGGVTARLKGVEAWDPLAAGRVLIWESRGGVKFVGDGHQRFGLIRRLNDERGFEHSLDGYLFKEADGWRAQDVRVVAALKNIRENSGVPMDAAKIFRDAPGALADRSLPVTGEFIAQARGLAALDDEAFRATVNRVIDERYAAEIGRNAADRPDLHMDMVRLMKAGDPANVDEARALVVEALQDDWVKAEGSQEDLFGYDPSVSAMIGRAKIAAQVTRQLGRDARLFGQLVKNADAIEAGGNALARNQNEARLAIDRAALEVTAKLALRHGAIGEAMARAAKAVAGGETPAKAAAPVLKALRTALEAGERLDTLRGLTLDPKPPTAAQEALVKAFDAPDGEGVKAQVIEAPEDLEADGAPGLFDDLDKLPEIAAAEKAERAHQALLACVPGV